MADAMRNLLAALLLLSQAACAGGTKPATNEKGESMPVWFEGSDEVACDIELVARAIEDHGEYLTGVVKLMPSLSSVELVEQGADFATIKTNEGLMKRTNVTKTVTETSVVVASDEEYRAGSSITVTTHFVDEFTASPAGVKHRAILSGVEAPGFMGFFYKKFGKNSIGSAYLKAHKDFFERLAPPDGG